MSQFNKYAILADGVARLAFGIYGKAVEELRRAEEHLKKCKEKGDTVLQITKAQADVYAQQEELEKAKAMMEKYKVKIAEIRADLNEELDDAFLANPSKINDKTLELLKSGILTSSEYEQLLINELEHDNFTLARLIGKYAKDEAEKRMSDNNGSHDSEVDGLFFVSELARGATSKNSFLNKFDVLMEAYDSCVKNTDMIQDWSLLTADIVKTF